MPIYEYKCLNCAKYTEVLQKISADPLTDCQYCHKPTLKRLISSSNFHLKGSGWYVTDFKNKDKQSKDENKNEGKGKDTDKDKIKDDNKGESQTKNKVQTKNKDQAKKSAD